MSPYDVSPDDEPLDVAAVSADDQRVEQLRHHALSPDDAVIWDDDDEELEPALALLRRLQRDVSTDLPAPAALPLQVTEPARGGRRLGRGGTIAIVAAGVLSIGGVAAASGPGMPLAGVRSAVSSAVHGVIEAITPDAPLGPGAARPTPSPGPSAGTTPPGSAVSAAARSAAAVQQIEANLDRAQAFLDQGKYAPAKAQLDAAASKLGYVLGAADRTRLGDRLAALAARLAATPEPTGSPRPGGGAGPAGAGKPTDNPGRRGQDGVQTGKDKPRKQERSRDPRVAVPSASASPEHSGNPERSGDGHPSPQPSMIGAPGLDGRPGASPGRD